MTKNKELLYPKEDAFALDEQGGYYARHVLAMTYEGLHSKADTAKQTQQSRHSKADTAKQLGARDLRINQLEVQLQFMGNK